MRRPFSGVVRDAVVAALLCALVTIAFRGTWGNGFAFDDADYIVNNRHLDRGLTAESVRWAFTSLDQANWHPLTWLSHLLDATLFGPGPRGPHAVNVAIHALNAVLLLIFLRLATGAFWPGAAVAAIFAVHPLRVESVAWIAERKDLLAGLFFLLMLLAYRHYLRRPGSGRYLAVATALLCGLLSKPMLVTVPLLLILLDFWPFGRFRGDAGRPPARLLLEKLPLLALVVAASAVTVLAQSTGRALASVARLPVADRVGNAVLAYAKYLAAAVWPANLSPMYQWPAGGHPLPSVLAAGAALATATFLLLRWRRHYPFLAVGWLWYLGMLVPVIGLVQVGTQTMADRYTYLPLLGPTMALVWGGAAAARRRRHGPAAAACLVLAALVPLALFTHRQVGFWRDDLSLFSRVLRIDPGNSFAHMNAGAQLADLGRLDEALVHFQAVAVGRPEPRLLTNIGKIHTVRGRSREALESFRRALRFDPGFTTARFELADLLHGLGRREEAVAEYRRALGEEPLDIEGRANLGFDLASLGRREEAVVELQEVLRLAPGHQGARALLDRLQAVAPPR